MKLITGIIRLYFFFAIVALLAACGGGGGDENPSGTPFVLNAFFTWVSGFDGVDQAGTYGVTSAANVPGARTGAASWTDGDGNLWLFGGGGLDRDGTPGYLNDLWKFDVTTGLWTWVWGSSTVNQFSFHYSGNTDSINRPGARSDANAWIDANGDLWLFGGYGYDDSGKLGHLNDLWKFEVSSGYWNWRYGGNSADPTGDYSVSAYPGGRRGAASWTDSNGDFWLFGGVGFDSTSGPGYLNDLWKYNTTTGWTWIAGSSTNGQPGVYTDPNPDNIEPGARFFSSTWADTNGDLWLLGGFGYGDSASGFGNLSDLWKFTVSSGLWSWIKGPATLNQSGVYGSQGVPAAGNVPGGRTASLSWIDPDGKLWLYSGDGVDGNGGRGILDDVWVFDGANWVWVWGSNTISPPAGSHGSRGIPDAANRPDARSFGTYWADNGDTFWVFGGQNGNLELLNDLWRFDPYLLFADTDGDGFGDPVTFDPDPVGGTWVTDNTDCNDDSAVALPGGIEVLDGVDNDCNGTIDEGFPKTVFVTSTPHRGDSFGGLAGADSICQNLADTAGLPAGDYVAWLSSSTIDARDRVTDDQNHPEEYRLVNGTLIATGFPDLVDSALENPINVDQTGSQLNVSVWTGTLQGGTWGGNSDHTCAGEWSSSATTGTTGFSGSNNFTWTWNAIENCISENRLYCFKK